VILAEIIALLGASGVGISAIVAWARKADREGKERKRFRDQMHRDLRDALASRDYRKLDDWLVIYVDELTPEVRKHVELRRDELYIEKNP
jgi:hypothetical protein